MISPLPVYPACPAATFEQKVFTFGSVKPSRHGTQMPSFTSWNLIPVAVGLKNACTMHVSHIAESILGQIAAVAPLFNAAWIGPHVGDKLARFRVAV